MSDFPELPANVTRNKANEAQVTEWQRKTKKQLPDIIDALRKDPRALEIFMDELALVD